jgi:hypothetical protein
LAAIVFSEQAPENRINVANRPQTFHKGAPFTAGARLEYKVRGSYIVPWPSVKEEFLVIDLVVGVENRS